MGESNHAPAGIVPSEAQLNAFVRAYFSVERDGQIGRCVAGLTAALNIDPKISAAPELADALKLALEYWEHRQQRYKNRCPAWVQSARAALAKAGA